LLTFSGRSPPAPPPSAVSSPRVRPNVSSHRQLRTTQPPRTMRISIRYTGTNGGRALVVGPDFDRPRPRSVASRVPQRARARNLAKRFRGHGNTWFRFITTPGDLRQTSCEDGNARLGCLSIGAVTEPLVTSRPAIESDPVRPEIRSDSRVESTCPRSIGIGAGTGGLGTGTLDTARRWERGRR